MENSNEIKKSAILHLVSDSTGDTLLTFTSALISKFPSVEFQKFTWFLTRTEAEMDMIIKALHTNQGIVMYTIVSPKFEERLQETCSKLNIPCIPILSKATRVFQRYLGKQSADIARTTTSNEI